MTQKSILEQKHVLIVDDEQDVLDTLEDLLPMCEHTRAADFDEAKHLLETRAFDIAVLDIMGVSGYELLDIAVEKGVTAVMLTAYALTPEDVSRSHQQGAAYFIPKEEMINIATFLEDVLEAKLKGKNPWSRWYERLAGFCERKFGPDFKNDNKDFLDRLTFH